MLLVNFSFASTQINLLQLLLHRGDELLHLIFVFVEFYVHKISTEYWDMSLRLIQNTAANIQIEIDVLAGVISVRISSSFLQNQLFTDDTLLRFQLQEINAGGLGGNVDFGF